MKAKIIALYLLLLVGRPAAASLFGLSRGRVLKIVDPLPEAPSDLTELSRQVPENPIQMSDLTKIVQKVAESNGLSIESQDSGMNIVDFHLSKKTGRSLNLIFNKESEELMRMTLSSDQEEVLGETQFSTFGAKEQDIQELLESTIQNADAPQANRKLGDEKTIEFSNFDADIIEPSGLKEAWDFTPKEETKEFEAVKKEGGKKVAITFSENEDKKWLILDDRPDKNKLISDHTRVNILLKSPIKTDLLIDELKQHLQIFENREKSTIAHQATAEDVTEFVKSSLPNTEIVEIEFEDKSRSRLLLVNQKNKNGQEEGSSSHIGSVNIQKYGGEFYKLEYLLFSRVLSLFVQADKLNDQKASMQREINQTFGTLLEAHFTEEDIAEILAKTMNKICGSDTKIEFASKMDSPTFTYFSQNKDDEGSCILARSDIFLTFHSFKLFGKMDEVHVFVSNPIVQTEMTFQPIADQLESSVSQFIVGLYGELNDAQAFYKTPSKDGSIDLESAADLIKSKGLTEAGDNTFELTNENGKLTIQLKESEEYLSVEVSVKKNTLTPGQNLEASNQIWIPKASNADEKKRLSNIIDTNKLELQ